MKLQKLAELLYRKASDEPLTAPSRRRDLFAHYILFGLLFGSVMLGYAAIMALQLADPIVKNIQVGPQLLFAANALFAALVFGFWLAQRQRHEYFYIATYATVCSLMRLRNLDVFRMEIPPQDLILFDTFLQSAEGGFGLLMALTFARSRLDLIRWGLPLLVGLPPILHWTLRLLGLPLPLHSILDGVYAPLLLALVSCLKGPEFFNRSKSSKNSC